MKKVGFFAVTLCSICLILLTACVGDDFPMTAEECYADEYFDPVDEACYLIEEEGDLAPAEEDEFFFDDRMTAADCFEDEVFDPVDEMCYVDATAFDDAEGPVAEWLDFFADELLDADVDFSDGEEGSALIVYTVSRSEIVDPEIGEAQTAAEEELQADRAAHQALWEQFATLIPQEYRGDITRYGVFSDGPDGTLAYVEPNPDAPTTWLIVLDPADTADQDDFTYTLIHEYGHVLTLNDRQVPFDEEAYFDEEGELAEQALDACPTYFTGEGCAQSSAYISAFYAAFWEDIYEDLPFPDEEGVVDEDELAAFYERYADRFLTEYAATNPGEDIAEAWTHFVLMPRPEGDSIAEQKILFFYAYPELVTLRQAVLSRLASEARR